MEIYILDTQFLRTIKRILYALLPRSEMAPDTLFMSIWDDGYTAHLVINIALCEHQKQFGWRKSGQPNYGEFSHLTYDTIRFVE